MPVKHIKKAVGKVSKGMDMRLVGLVIVVIAVIAIALWLMQAQPAPVAPTPTPVLGTPTPEATVEVATPTPAGTPTPVYTTVVPGGQVTEKPHCTDGTAEGECNAISYMYCAQAPMRLNVDCTKCGCPSDMTCNAESKACRS
ncbi:MAG: hypothetical protein NTY90_04050 [Candidatus Micrarchaeota archaeon]|nr:hypothetical protein [Candidatus Micrarchaeota archaeon]